MMDLREQFETVLAEFGDLMDVRLTMGDENECWLEVDGAVDIRLAFDAENDAVDLWSPVGELPPGAAANGLAHRLLALCGDADASCGFVLGMDGGTRALAVCGDCPASWLYSAGRLADWLERLVAFHGQVRAELAVR